jgi:hypothetical protein
MALGAVYLAFGRPYLAMALISARSLQAVNPHMPILIVTNVIWELPSDVELDSRLATLKYIEIPEGGAYLQKTRLFDLSPFDRTVFLDCDTLILGDLGIGDVFLRHFDVACALQQRPPRLPRGMKLLDGVPMGDLPHWNSGVILFKKNDRTARFFRKWEERSAVLGTPLDQPSFAEAIFLSDVRLLSLNQHWNGYVSDWRSPPADAKVHHYMMKIDSAIKEMIVDVDRRFDALGAKADNSVERYLLRRKERKRRGRIRSIISRLKRSFT